MFKKILIANRGEIACRVIKTARKMGIKTVAVYSDADKDALHVEMADEAVHIGPPPSAQSYLVIDRIVQACRDTGAEAVHPGYGFLSEREAFAEALARHGIVFIGPNVRAIAAMGDKIESKKLAQAAKVNTVPGFIGEITDDNHARRIAKEIGYPVMVKASAGGGGKGLRIVHKEDELVQAIKSSQHEAKASFGDDRLFIEKFVTEPRHIEIQVMGDKHGNVVYLNERECSIQRRNQKVIEEAPSPFLDAATRKAMGEQAVMLAKAVGYDSAGTVEFIVDKDRKFYFLEMNTRLQVEHPVTELITGLDLVELMIRSAFGEKLPIKQSDVGINGWAVEARVYAEDPYRGFLPSTGRLVRYRPPAERASRTGITIRNDTGVYEGGEISMFYDPMIAKLCTHAPTRTDAIDAMATALDQFRIEGISHNINFLTAIMHNAKFRSGKITTAFIAEEFPDGFHGLPMDDTDRSRFVAAASAARLVRALRASGISGTMNGAYRIGRDFVVSLDGRAFQVTNANLAAGNLHLNIDGKPYSAVTDWLPGQPIMYLNGTSDGEHAIQISRCQGGYKLGQGGRTVTAIVRSPLGASLAALMPEKVAPDTSKMLLCPMPGLVVSINVKEGQEVKAGEALAVVEAMKMENVLTAQADGTVKKINATKGDSLAVDEVIMEFA
ncbi:MAG: acetyl/propionyl/methylcrotonyl-CoA carboxylase subunit alpha [Alphaproteobacteria bacterium]|nr:acetyl/propionyl/methylcrotonyl-CoA carboxylase subunit alpha [Alphaproteobacteria bacterium]MBL6939531.1 acetyl/propionyl/methylcrotonyl-CoA carboxylase subunit alpha [Alphaproteobacteria bacterium]MBL7100095.1 acetyl/propionyl/methylcrotonyl-CoA carboxylase subunit alpha [Alphaproteobacteria bacterium]